MCHRLWFSWVQTEKNWQKIEYTRQSVFLFLFSEFRQFFVIMQKIMFVIKKILVQSHMFLFFHCFSFWLMRPVLPVSPITFSCYPSSPLCQHLPFQIKSDSVKSPVKIPPYDFHFSGVIEFCLVPSIYLINIFWCLMY